MRVGPPRIDFLRLPFCDLGVGGHLEFMVLRCLLTVQRRDGKKPILRLSTWVCKERKAGIIPRELGVLFWMMGRCALDAIERSAVAYASYRDPVRCAGPSVGQSTYQRAMG